MWIGRLIVIKQDMHMNIFDDKIIRSTLHTLHIKKIFIMKL